jgi:hypothetical protein
MADDRQSDTPVRAETKPRAEPLPTANDAWLLLIYRVPQDPPGRRTHVWRQLKQLGAVYLQQAAAILPTRPELRADLEYLAARIREFGGEVSLLDTTSPSVGWGEDLTRQFNQARDAEYAEVIENIERFEDEIRRETRKGKFTFAELEDLESDWEKLQRWIGRVRARDFFDATGYPLAREAIERGKRALHDFIREVYAHEGMQGEALGDI